jgi:putative phosphonate metabolism protein
MPPDARYAIYFVPLPDTALYRFGASVLGIDIYTGEAVAFPPDAGANWSDAIREPRTYGFHGTLKAPFRLSPGATEDELFAALDAFAADQPHVDAGPIEVTAINDFIALVPRDPCPPLGKLASACVRNFDDFRAPMTQAERERRLRSPLSPRQVRQMDTWGYPFVLDDFRFHMTLTGAMRAAERAQIFRWLKQIFAERAKTARLVISQIVVARQNGGVFSVCHCAALNAGR